MCLRNDQTYLEHVLDAIDAIEGYINGAAFDEFTGNRMMVDAVVRELEIIGEASSRLSSGLRQQYPDVPFRDARDMRNFLIHEYFGVNERVVWDTCHEDLPVLKQAVLQLLGREKRQT